LDGLVRGLAAGLSIQELRAILRGDQPTERPNPRYKAQVTSFLLHIRPRFFYRASTAFTHTFRLGFLTTFLFAIEIITGIILMVYYIPTPDGAYASVLRIMSEVPFGEVTRDVHRLAAEAMVVLAFLHMLRVFLTGSFKKERRFTWLTGVLLLILTLGLSFSGYLLPWDQLAYWAVTIGTSMVEAIPFIGSNMNIILRGSAEIGADGLLRFYLLHIILLPALLAAVFGAHYYRIARTHNISLPVRVEEGEISETERARAYEKINLIPDVLFNEAFLIALGTLVLIGSAHFLYNAPLEHHADPVHTPIATQAPWFFLWVQGLLKFGDKTWMGVIIPTVVFIFLFAIPYIDRGPFRSLKKRPLALPLAILSIIVLVWFSYTGTASYGIHMPAVLQIAQDFAPEEGLGRIHSIPFAALRPGAYIVGQSESADLPDELQPVFTEFEQRVQLAASSEKLTDVQALIIVEDEQLNLKKITIRITWQDADDGSKSFEKISFIHRDHTGSLAVPMDAGIETTGLEEAVAK